MGYRRKERFLHVGSIAKQVGLGHVYDGYYPLLSKAAHPTATIVLLGDRRKRFPGVEMARSFINRAIWGVIRASIRGHEGLTKSLSCLQGLMEAAPDTLLPAKVD
jgi:hypothetical protein